MRVNAGLGNIKIAHTQTYIIHIQTNTCVPT